MESGFKIKTISVFILMILTFEHKVLYAQPFNDLLKKLLVKDENINSSRFVLKKANNDLSAAFSSYTPKLDITVFVF